MKKSNLTLAFLILNLSILISPFANAQSPSIISFNPSSGAVGTLVTITGTDLSTPTAFAIGGTTSIAVSNNGTQLVGLVMPGALTGAVSVTTSGGTISSSSDFTITSTHYPSIQQGSKLLGTGATGAALQGYAVSISADGNTAIVGGADDDSKTGAAWIFIRSGGVWTQQGSKLVGTGAVGSAQQGVAVSISADGNTVIVGGNQDNSGVGAVWIYTRFEGVWTQQGNKLVGTGAAGKAYQGEAVAISADGNTAIVGGSADNTLGATWIYTRSAGVWTQQGNKLVGTGAINVAFTGVYQGSAVSLSADGNTAIVGGFGDNNAFGATWIFIRSGGVWTQQGNKLVDTLAAKIGYQGRAVSLSADGNTAIVGGNSDNSNSGAAWIYTRSAGVWTQQGNKLVGIGSTGAAQQGRAVSLSADGNTAIVGGWWDNSYAGGVWVFTRSAEIWTQQGSKLVGTGATGKARQGWVVSLSADGSTAIVGGHVDNSNVGAAWVFSLDSCTKPTISISGNMSICKGTSTSLMASGAISYTWSPTTGIDNPNSAIVSANPTNTTTYFVTGTDAHSCYGVGIKKLIVNNCVTSISENEFLNNSLKIYPNPASDHLTITFQTIKESHAIVRLLDMRGNEVYPTVNQMHGNNETTIDLSNHAKGIYFINVLTNAGTITKKVVLE